MTVQQAFDNFIMSRQLADLTEKSIDDYTSFVQPFVSAVGSDSDFSKLTQDDINLYISDILKQPISKSSKATYIRHVKVFLNWASQEYPVLYFPKKIKVPKTPKKEVQIYTDNEIIMLFDSVVCDAPWLEYRNKLILALMYDSGLRQAEVCHLKRKWISVGENRTKVLGKGNKERVVPLGRLTLEYLKKYLALCPFDSEFLLVSNTGEPLTCNAVKKMVYKLSNKLDFDVSSHKLRHNFGTNYCLDQYEKFGQVDIYKLMYLMGHEDIETTNRYLHFAMEIIATRNHVSHLDKVAL